MSPVARALDLIQGAVHAYLGTLLPTIATTVFKLQDINQWCIVVPLWPMPYYLG